MLIDLIDPIDDDDDDDDDDDEGVRKRQALLIETIGLRGYGSSQALQTSTVFLRSSGGRLPRYRSLPARNAI